MKLPVRGVSIPSLRYASGTAPAAPRLMNQEGWASKRYTGTGRQLQAASSRQQVRQQQVYHCGLWCFTSSNKNFNKKTKQVRQAFSNLWQQPQQPQPCKAPTALREPSLAHVQAHLAAVT